MHKYSLTVVLALLISLPALGQKVDLRGPAPQQGDAYTTTSRTTGQTGKMEIVAQGQTLPGQMTMDSTTVIDVELQAVKDGQPTKVQTTFTKSVSKTKTVMLGQEQEQEETSMQGAVMTQTKTDDGWSTTVKGGNVPAEAKDIIKNAGYVDQRLIFPDHEVAVGEEWEIKDELLQSFMGQSGIPGAKMKGTIVCKLVEIKNVDGKQVAVIDYQMDGTITMEMSPNPQMTMDMTIRMAGKGKMNRNLTDWTTDQDFAGDMDMDMATSVNGQQALKMTATMPMDVKTTQTRK